MGNKHDHLTSMAASLVLNSASSAISDQLQLAKHIPGNTNPTGNLVFVNKNVVENRRPLDMIYINGPIPTKFAAPHQQRPLSVVMILLANQLN